MRVRRVTKVLITAYIWGFIIYQTLPVRIIPFTNYAPKDLSPMPVIYTYTYAYGVKTAFSHHTGSIRNLIETLREMDIDFAFGDFPEVIAYRLYPKPKETPCVEIRTSDVSVVKRFLHTIFEVVPSRLLLEKPEDILSRTRVPPADCYTVAHDRRVLLSTFLGLELPSYSAILGSGKNLFFSREVLIRSPDPDDVLRSTIVILNRSNLIAFAYSERSFYLPGEETFYDFRYVLETDVRNPLIYVFHDDELFGIYAQNRINLPVTLEGSYRAVLMSYKFRVGVVYFGIRTEALIPPIRLM